MKRTISLLACMTALASPALALTEPQPMNDAESAVRTVEYVRGAVVKVEVPANGETLILFSPDEGSLDFSVSQQAWRHGDTDHGIVVAPNPGAGTTWAHAVATLPDGTTRPYTFELSVAQPPAPSVVASTDGAVPPPSRPVGYATVQFTYAAESKASKARAAAVARKAALMAPRSVAATPAVIKSSAPAPVHCRSNFMWRGAAVLLPRAAGDCGFVTRFLWPGQLTVPSISIVTAEGHEQSVTQAPDPAEHGLVVIPQTWDRWLLRSNGLVTELWNASYNPLAEPPAPPDPAPIAPHVPFRQARR